MSYSQQRTQPPAGHRSLRRTFHDCEYSIILNLPWLFDTVFRDPSSPDACSSNSGGNLKGGEKRFSKLNFFENVGIYTCTGEERNKQKAAWENVEMRGRKEERKEGRKDGGWEEDWWKRVRWTCSFANNYFRLFDQVCDVRINRFLPSCSRFNVYWRIF